MVESANLLNMRLPGHNSSPPLAKDTKAKSHPRVAFLFCAAAERSKAPAGLARGIRRAAPAGAALSESSICHRCAVARLRRRAQRQKFPPTLFHAINLSEYQHLCLWSAKEGVAPAASAYIARLERGW